MNLTIKELLTGGLSRYKVTAKIESEYILMHEFFIDEQQCKIKTT
jgi:hypothetical protein